MKIEPLGAPRAVEGQISSMQKAAEVRNRAIAKFATPPANLQAAPVQNPTQVSPEELGAIQPLSADSQQRQEPEQQEKQGQNPHSEESVQSPAPKEATQPAKDETTLSAQYAQLARKEKQMQAKARELKALEMSLRAQSDAAQAPKAQQPSGDYISKADLARDPWSVLSQNGISYEQLTQQALNAPSPEALEQRQVVSELRAELKSLRDAQENTQKSIQESQTQYYQNAIKQLRMEANQLVQNDAAYEASKVYGKQAVDTIVKVIEDTYHDEDYIMSVEDAAKEVEDYFAEEAYKLARLNKIQARFKAQTAPTTQQTEPQKQQSQMKTLTNAHGSSRPLSAKERAVLAFKGELKN